MNTTRTRGFTRASISLILTFGLIGAALLPATAPRAEALLGLGGVIVFSSSRVTPDNPEGDSEIFSMRPNGTGIRQLTDNDAVDAQPAISRDGKRIVFVSNRDPQSDPDAATYELYVMRADGSKQTRLTNNDTYEDFPAWSPDGEQIAFETSRDDPSIFKTTSIYVMRDDGSNQTRITTPPAETYDFEPTWSPDGQWIAFNREGAFDPNEPFLIQNEILRVRATGGAVTNLTNHPAQDEAPAWSPDGERIVFWSDRDDDLNGDLYMMDADGGNPTRLTNHPDFEHFPSWSPDGRRITFARFDEVVDSNDIYVMRANGSQVQRITTDPAADDNPDWGKKNGLLGGILDLAGKQGQAEGKDRDGGRDKGKDRKGKQRGKDRHGAKGGKRR